MSKDQEKLQDTPKNVGKNCSEQLIYTCLLQLLTENEDVHELIRKIMKGEGANKKLEEDPAHEIKPCCDVNKTLISQQPVLPVSPVAVDNLRQELSAELTLLELVKADTELSAAWLQAAQDTEGTQLVRLIAVAAQWDQVLQLWDRLAARCKLDQRAASQDEQKILAGSINVHNLIWQGKHAKLQYAELGVDYDYQNHERGTARGDKVTTEWLPGILNAARQLQKKPLVKTNDF